MLNIGSVENYKIEVVLTWIHEKRTYLETSNENKHKPFLSKLEKKNH